MEVVIFLDVNEERFYGYKHWTLEEVPRCFRHLHAVDRDVSRVAKILWVENEGENPHPQLCLREIEKNGLLQYDFLDLEIGQSYRMFDKDLHIFMILGLVNEPNMGKLVRPYYKILNLERGTITRVIVAAINTPYDNMHIKWERIV